MDAEQGSLFESEVGDTDPLIVGSLPAQQEAAFSEIEGLPGYYLTNSFNLVSILSSCLIGPRESFDKYYPDLLDKFPGWVPILHAPPGQEMMAEFEKLNESGLAVILELDREDLQAQSGPDVTFVRSLPLSTVKRIHFSDEEALKRFTSRSYANVRKAKIALCTSPWLFASESGPKLGSPPESSGPGIDWQKMDRVRGAASALLHSARSGDQIVMVGEFFGGLGSKESMTTPPWFRWPIPTLLVSELGDARDRAENLMAVMIFEVLQNTERSKHWSPARICHEILSRCNEENAPSEVVALISRDIDRILQIINLERDFRPFQDGGKSLDTTRALLLVLIHPDLAELLAWPESATGADDFVRLLASWFAGCLRGLSREDIQLRDERFDHSSALWATSAASEVDPVFDTVSVEVEAMTTRVWLSADMVLSAGAVRPSPETLYLTIPEDKRSDVRKQISTLFEWPVIYIAVADADAFVATTNTSVTITSSRPIVVTFEVDEESFVTRLETQVGGRRQQLQRLLSL